MSVDIALPKIATPVDEPPVMVNFTFLGKTLRARPITDGQLAAISMAKGEPAGILAVTTRIIKSRVGDANWAWMHGELLDGNAEFTDIVGVLNQLAQARTAVTPTDEV